MYSGLGNLERKKLALMSSFANGAMHLRIKIHCHSLYAAGSSVREFLMMASNENKKLEHASAKILFSKCVHLPFLLS